MTIAELHCYGSHDEDGAECWRLELKVGVQSFTLDGTFNADEAEWMARQLRIALREAGATVDDVTRYRKDRFPFAPTASRGPE